MSRAVLLLASLALFAAPLAAQEPEWAAAMTEVHARFTGEPGTLAQFGDSISDTMAFWTPLLYERKNASPQMEAAYELVHEHLKPECWREWKGPEFGNQGTQTAAWAEQHVDEWLERLNPEACVILFGSNDLNNVGVDGYTASMRTVVEKCLANGTVVMLTTVPPRSGFAEKSAEFAQAMRDLAAELSLPLIDYHAEILQRRPDDWDGSLEKFAEYEGYNVPTLICRDGVHPSHPEEYRSDYSDDALNACGYSLRNYLTLMTYADVLRQLQ